ncbi:MAG: FG-GAP-like repeat-containing protein [Planctomycetota bacterium]
MKPKHASRRAASGWLLLATVLGLPMTRLAGQAHLIRTLRGTSPTGEFGAAIAGVGDVDKDGRPDVLIGAPGAAKVYLYSGRNGKLLRTLSGPSRFGGSLSSVGDIDKDGYPDWIVGASAESQVFSGKDGSLIRKHAIATSAVEGVGDVDKDLVPDYVVGSSKALTYGAAYLFSGKDGKLLRTYRGLTSGTDFGARLAAMGDVNGDGIPDIAIAAPGERPGRYVQLVSGKDNTVLWTVKIGFTASLFGNALSNVGDLDRDGVSDLSVGMPWRPGPSVHMFSGRTGKSLFSVSGSPRSFFGDAVSSVGDVDRDGHPDIAVGAPVDARFGIDAGSVEVFSGQNGKRLLLFAGRGDERIGVSLADVGDLDGDGAVDLAAAARLWPLGQVHIYAGGASGTRAAYAWMFNASGSGNKPPPMLLGGKLPLLAKTSSMELRAAGYDFAVLLESLGSLPRALPLRVAGWPLAVHLDPAGVVNAFVVPLSSAGSGTINLPFPNDPALPGLTIAWQAVTFAFTGPGDLGATNLVLANLGTLESEGYARYPFQFEGELAAMDNLRDALGRPRPVFANPGPHHYLTLSGSLAAKDMGPIEIRTAPGAPPEAGGLRLATIPSGRLGFEQRFWVPPGSPSKPLPLYLWNTNRTRAAKIKWRVAR